MLIIANTLDFNGGTTFILRYCRESYRRGKRMGVLVMTGKNASPLPLYHEICKYADVYYLEEFMRFSASRALSNTPLIGFLPINIESVNKIIIKHNNSVHVMGVFGLLFINKVVGKISSMVRISVGIYHQNEFMFNSNWYFTKLVHRIFKKISSNGVVFFNEANINSYSIFFDIDYSSATLVPIGIELPLQQGVCYGSSSGRQIVSIGNLYNFKTYNQHIITIMPSLIKLDPEFSYEIYGDGPYEKELREIVEKLGIVDKVNFNGRIPYSEFATVLHGAFMFVGSGTALVEAAALGVPAMIGIESSKQAITYGFLNEINGYSYNEFEINRTTFEMQDKIQIILDDSESWERVSKFCQDKAADFSISKTYELIEKREYSFPVLIPEKMNVFIRWRVIFSFLLCIFFHVCKIDRSFSNRRDQGTIS
ncbi:glycosyltransferase [Aeromonas sp. 1HA1]|uniref:glycosyltransferase n=1 Tax=Aeromonas sp. 1HA1 TaxID=2699193 RepID=UPI0023DD9262|nr:glycosyltransferase [Aeromonas sp. 1HA1]MDF2414981.1 glycosyltransferase [Aeromonas sp. 1HA1]